MVCLNVAKKLYAHTEFKDEVVAAMQATGADIMLLTETGSADEMARAAMRNYAIAGNMYGSRTNHEGTKHESGGAGLTHRGKVGKAAAHSARV